MFNRNLLMIVNPCAGQRHAVRALGAVIGVLQSGGYRCTVLLTEKSGDGTRLAQQYGGDYDVVVAVGGDGTLNEVVAGMHAGGFSTPLGYLPAGSTNDFASSLGLPGDMSDAAQIIAAGHPHALDVGEFNGRLFIYVASFGAFTRASYATPQSVKNSLGHLAYILEGMKDLPNIRSTHMRLQIDGGEHLEGDYIFGAVSNSTSLGGLLKLDPSVVDMNDGLLELLLIRLPVDLVELAQMLAALNSKRYDTSNCITFRSAHRIEIDADPKISWTLDGERADGAAHITVRNRHDAIQLFLP